MTTQIAEQTHGPLDLEYAHGAHTYHPLPVVITEAEGAWVSDEDGRRYLDCLAGYSALNFGHRHPAVIAAAVEQLHRVTLTSRAFHHDQLGPLCAELAELTGKDMVLPMNSGAEAVETALKLARKWGHQVKGVAQGRAKIVVAEGNFHGRTISIISFSGDAEARDEYGPYTPGFISVPYGNAEALAAAVDDDTVAVLIEPIQGEAGVIIPPAGYLKAVRDVCTERGVLMIADEIQSGLGRTGTTFACEREQVVPDVYVLGKALGGGILPLSAVAADTTSWGCSLRVRTAAPSAATRWHAPSAARSSPLLKTGEYQERAARLAPRLRDGLEALQGKGLVGVRVVGLWAGIDLDPALGTGRDLCEALMHKGVLTKDTHGSTIRLSPPLTISDADLDWMLGRLDEALGELRAR
jgi:ornithine--oxo-acid transaminase